MSADRDASNIAQRTACASPVRPRRSRISTFHGPRSSRLCSGMSGRSSQPRASSRRPAGEEAFADLPGRHAFGAGEASRRDVSVNIAACVGDVRQGARQHAPPVVVFPAGPMVEALAHQVFEFIQPGCTERLREGGDDPTAGTVVVGEEQVEDLRGQALRIAPGNGDPGPSAVGDRLADGVADYPVRVVRSLEQVRIEPDQASEQFGRGERLRRKQVFGDRLPDPVELVSQDTAFAVVVKAPIGAKGVDLACQRPG